MNYRNYNGSLITLQSSKDDLSYPPKSFNHPDRTLSPDHQAHHHMCPAPSTLLHPLLITPQPILVAKFRCLNESLLLELVVARGGHRVVVGVVWVQRCSRDSESLNLGSRNQSDVVLEGEGLV